jgi:type II secretory ATPase GspE/PulE/Tfp pilus assembly ATPase PilB-like protein
MALEEGMVSLRQDAIRKVVAGQTTPEEVFRSVYLEG